MQRNGKSLLKNCHYVFGLEVITNIQRESKYSVPFLCQVYIQGISRAAFTPFLYQGNDAFPAHLGGKRGDIMLVFPPHLVRSCSRANEHKRGKEAPGPPECD